MFGNKETKARPADIGQGSINIIGTGTQIKGDVSSAGDIRVDGTITGKITSKAKVVIGPSSVVNGDIEAQNADISGNVTGKVMVTETLFLKSTAFIKGDILVNRLVVESGAEFNGNCNMITSERRPPASENVIQQNGKAAKHAEEQV